MVDELIVHHAIEFSSLPGASDRFCHPLINAQ